MLTVVLRPRGDEPLLHFTFAVSVVGSTYNSETVEFSGVVGYGVMIALPVAVKLVRSVSVTVVDCDVKFYAAGTPITITDPIDGSGNYISSGFTYQTPPSGSNATVVARAFYRWPLYVTGLGYNIANIGRNTASSKRLLAATAAFHVEP